MIFGIDSQTGFQRSPSLSKKKKLNLSENKYKLKSNSPMRNESKT